MKYYIPFLMITFFFLSCKKETKDEPVVFITTPDSIATYKIVVALSWQKPQFTVPENVHVTKLIGMLHSKDTFLWKPDAIATKGLEYVAEIGSNDYLNAEIDSIIAHGKGLSKFALPAPAVTGNIETTMDFTTGYSCFSFASMIAPSPDWFMGINSTNLLKDNKWITDITIPVLLYDAGTEEGDIFGYNNPPTDPQQPIRPLTPLNAMVLANGNASIGALGTVRFERIK